VSKSSDVEKRLFADCRNMRIKGEIIVQNDNKSGYLFRNTNHSSFVPIGKMPGEKERLASMEMSS